MLTENLLQQLSEVETREGVRIIYAVESGSRAWGFASPESDFDVRFIYVRPLENYLRLGETPDFIDWQLDKTFDVNGWDVAKTLRQFMKSNATLFEWANSPIVYKTTDEWEKIFAVAQKYFSPKSTFVAYAGFAKNIGLPLLKRDAVKPKTYLYALRTIFCRNFVAEKLCPPPVAFEKLLPETLPENLRAEIFALLELKKSSAEKFLIEKIPALHEFIAAELRREKLLKETLPKNISRSWKSLDEIFLQCLKGEL